MAASLPTELTVHQQSRVLEIAFDDGARFRIPFELMRVYSPSAEVQGHGPGQEVLQTGKRDVQITDIAEQRHDPISGYPTWRQELAVEPSVERTRIGAADAGVLVELEHHQLRRVPSAGLV